MENTMPVLSKTKFKTISQFLITSISFSDVIRENW